MNLLACAVGALAGAAVGLGREVEETTPQLEGEEKARRQAGRTRTTGQTGADGVGKQCPRDTAGCPRRPATNAHGDPRESAALRGPGTVGPARPLWGFWAGSKSG